eukprot:gene20733-15252_t
MQCPRVLEEIALGTGTDASLTIDMESSSAQMRTASSQGELDSPNAALAKAIQVSHDFLYRAVRVLNVPINDVAIPFVVLCGGLVQFGAIYSPMQEFHPVPVLVTPPLHLYSN